MVHSSTTNFARAALTVLIVCGANYAAELVSLPTGDVIGTSNYADGSLRAAGPREELVYRRIAAPLNSTWICLHFIEFSVAPQTAFKVFVNAEPEVSMVYSSYPKPNVQCFEADYIQIFYNGFISESGFIIVAAPDPQHDGVSYHHLKDKSYLAEPEHSTKLEVLSPGVYSGERFDVVSEAGKGYGANQLLSWRFALPASPVGLQWICLHFSRFSTQFNKDKLLVFTDEIQQSSQFSGSRKPFSVCRQSSQLNMVFASEEAQIDGGVLGFVTYSREFYEAPKKVRLSPLDDETMADDVLLRSKRARYIRYYRSSTYYYGYSSYNYGYRSYRSVNAVGIGLGVGIPAFIITIVLIVICFVCCKRRATNYQGGVVYNASTGQTQPVYANVTTYPTATADPQTGYPTAGSYPSQPGNGSAPYPTGIAAPYLAAGAAPYPTTGAAPYPTSGAAPYPTVGASPYPTGTAPTQPSLPPPDYSDVSKVPT